MLKVALVGAGGKMGLRLTHNLKNSGYLMSYHEVNPSGIEKLNEKGVNVSDPAFFIPLADIVILAVPDVALEKVSSEVIPTMKEGCTCSYTRSGCGTCRKTAQKRKTSHIL